MQLYKFTNGLAGTDPSAPPFRIPARELDRNFALVKPLQTGGNSRQYMLTETPDGWSLKIFPDFPNTSTLHVLGVSGGQLTWVPTQSC